MNQHPILMSNPQQQEQQQQMLQQQQHQHHLQQSHELNANENDIANRLSAAIAPLPQGHMSQSYDGLPNIAESSLQTQQLDHSMMQGSMDQVIGGEHGSGGDDDGNAGRKGNKAGSGRELSSSKRAAQNRAAQRAFRQRKEGYIKKLEEQVQENQRVEEQNKAMQTEIYSLREYIIHLQSRLIESHGEYPPVPAHLNLDLGAPTPPVPQMTRRQPQQQPPQNQGQQQFSMAQTAAAVEGAQSLEERAISQLQARQAQPQDTTGLQQLQDSSLKPDSQPS